MLTFRKIKHDHYVKTHHQFTFNAPLNWFTSLSIYVHIFGITLFKTLQCKFMAKDRP